MGMGAADAQAAFARAGVHVLRRSSGAGRFRPHCTLAVERDGGLLDLGVDTTRARAGGVEPDAYLITHAHSDHHGASAMRSPQALASRETALALEIRHGRAYAGAAFDVGATIDVGGLAVRTHPTHHTIGACAYSFVTERGARVLVTGDVKSYREMPRCDLLVVEANYGDPDDAYCRFEDDLDGLRAALEEPVALGAYVFGKAQRTVALARVMGYDASIEMDPLGLALTRALLPDAGELVRLGENGSRVAVVPPQMVGGGVGGRRRFVLTGNRRVGMPRIALSDHLDFRGLVGLVDRCRPESALVYHPAGSRARAFAAFLRERVGIPACTTEDLGDAVQRRL